MIQLLLLLSLMSTCYSIFTDSFVLLPRLTLLAFQTLVTNSHTISCNIIQKKLLCSEFLEVTDKDNFVDKEHTTI